MSQIATDATESVLVTDNGIISSITFVSYEEFIRENIFAQSGVNIDRSHSPRLGSQNPTDRREWEEAQNWPSGEPSGNTRNNSDHPDLLKANQGGCGWDLVNDILR